MSEQDSENKPETAETSSTVSTAGDPETTSTETTDALDPVESSKEETEVDLSKCEACRAALDVACKGLVVGGMIVINETATDAVVAALKTLRLKSNAEKVKAWIDEAADAGVTNINWLAEFLCKKAGVC